MFTAHAPGDPTRLFIAERGTPIDGDKGNSTANIRILNLTTGLLESEPFLTVPQVNVDGEGGLLGMAFHPDYAQNGKFYLNFTANDSIPDTPFSTYIREYTRSSSNPNLADSTFTPILELAQPQTTHNGGWIGFGPNDGYLYIMSGDGGGSNDEGTGHTPATGNAQDLTNLLGKVLRIDVDRDDFPTDATKNYGIPHDIVENDVIVTPGNPFAPNAPGETDPTGDNEIWAYGLRNPFRAGFDRATGNLWIGDVGQASREEINFQPGDSAGGENYGWRLREGSIETPWVGGPKPPDNVDPVWDYLRPTPGADPNFTGNVVVGGVPYRGPDPTLQGLYFFADTAQNRIWTLRLPTDTEPVDVDFVSPQLPFDVAFGTGPVAISEDAVGNLYITYLYRHSVYRIKTNALTEGDFNADANVDADDLALWQAGFGDLDGADFLAWQRNLGWSSLNVPATPASALVPEPAGAALLAACVFAAAAWRRGARADRLELRLAVRPGSGRSVCRP
jgi:hypothetical protein